MAGGDKKVLSYGDVVLWGSDVELLKGNSFLNDRLIEFFFAQLEVPYDCLLLAPAVTFWISHCEDAAFVMSTVAALCLPDRKVVMFAVNDNEDVSMVGGGCHWSLLVYIRESNEFQHYDSMGGMNAIHARKLATIIKPFLDAASAKFEAAWTPHQVNGYDCGVYVMAVGQVLCDAYTSGRFSTVDSEALIKEKITPNAVRQMRHDVLNRILSLAEEQGC
ncbi:hypothetical protein KP509_09G087000 [Ceratopteris richardii]|uniref:Ubiquitin-like protease family profile domain-containing protein n=1 Tax=Ceratopteris richardii TaxID=49495 RepID=A0A8T2U8D9_CERRI|nr:hypothetical protein KP509_09G087000 [Ceratopteris richardii]